MSETTELTPQAEAVCFCCNGKGAVLFRTYWGIERGRCPVCERRAVMEAARECGLLDERS